MSEDKKSKEKMALGSLGKLTTGFGLFEKSKCSDLFDQTKVDGLNMYEPRSNRVKIKFKFRKKQMDEQLLIIKFILAIGGLNDVFYIKALLRKYELVKQSFVLDIE